MEWLVCVHRLYHRGHMLTPEPAKKKIFSLLEEEGMGLGLVDWTSYEKYQKRTSFVVAIK